MTFEVRVQGRVNLIGEHTDYNNGWVLPTAIPQGLVARLRSRDDGKVVCSSKQIKGEFAFELGREAKTGQWIDYVQGATKILRSLGHQVQGFELEVDSHVPVGSGLSSSAALEIAVLKLLRQRAQVQLSDRELAKIGQRIENEFVGANVGIMDQMACAHATWGEALFLDTMSLEFKPVRLPLDAMDLIVINSGVEHRNTGGGYNQRRSECEAACRELGVPSLREVRDVERLNGLPDILKRRSRHVVTENNRVHQAVDAIRSQNLERLGELFMASHASMRDDYEVSIPEIDTLVELCAAHREVFGARLTGGGFGGSIVAIAKKGSGLSVADDVVQSYQTRYPEKATVLVPTKA